MLTSLPRPLLPPFIYLIDLFYPSVVNPPPFFPSPLPLFLGPSSSRFVSSLQAGQVHIA